MICFRDTTFCTESTCKNFGDDCHRSLTEDVKEQAKECVDWPADVPSPDYCDSFTWTTHRIQTKAGVEVIVRWLGESNGYYGEDVHFGRTHKPLTT